jgi:hypothetical protein
VRFTKERSEWSRRWREVDPARRRRIVGAVRRGQAVDDARDAPLAVEFIDNQGEIMDRLLGTRKRRLHIWILVGIGILVGVLTRNLGGVVVALIPVAWLLWSMLAGRYYEARMTTSRAKNVEQIDRLS